MARSKKSITPPMRNSPPGIMLVFRDNAPVDVERIRTARAENHPNFCTTRQQSSFNGPSPGCPVCDVDIYVAWAKGL